MLDKDWMVNYDETKKKHQEIYGKIGVESGNMQMLHREWGSVPSFARKSGLTWEQRERQGANRKWGSKMYEFYFYAAWIWELLSTLLDVPIKILGILVLVQVWKLLKWFRQTQMDFHQKKSEETEKSTDQGWNHRLPHFWLWSKKTRGMEEVLAKRAVCASRTFFFCRWVTLAEA